MSSKSAAVEAPESWEVADLDDAMGRLLLSSTKKELLSSSSSSDPQELIDGFSDSGSDYGLGLGSGSVGGGGGKVSVSDDAVNQVDQFLREALQNPRERLSVLRMEQDVEKFISDPTQHQLEFQQLPTSYLRLAAHRVAQHYLLQSMVLLDNSLPDGSGSTIIVRKTAECRRPPIRLADIPVTLPSEGSNVVKVAIKQRPQKRSQNSGNSNSSKSNISRSVEERKEEYNRARARIFNSSSSSGGKPESEPRLQGNSPHGPLRISKVEEKTMSGVPDIKNLSSEDLKVYGGLVESSSSNSRSSARNRIEKEPVGPGRTNPKQNSRVAIFRDREHDRKDPDYDRNYDRYTQRFDPGFGFNGGPSYTMQPMYTPAVNYNTEFPTLGGGSTPRPHISTEHQHQQARPLPQHMAAQWAAATSIPPGVGYGHPDAMMTPFNPNLVGPRSTSAVYMHPSQFHYQRPGIPYVQVQPHEHLHHQFSQFWVSPAPIRGMGHACTLPAGTGKLKFSKSDVAEPYWELAATQFNLKLISSSLKGERSKLALTVIVYMDEHSKNFAHLPCEERLNLANEISERRMHVHSSEEGILSWGYQVIQPPPPKLCGTSTVDGPPVTAPRIKLRDGRHLAYKEHGVDKEIAKVKIIFVHGLACCRHDEVIVEGLSQEVTEKLGVFLVSFDKPGIGESDPDPKRTMKSLALDIEELGDQLGLGSEFYVIGYSMGGQAVWACLKYIPHRLAGAVLLAPVVNYWWSGFPTNLANEAYKQHLTQDQWAIRIVHYAPWLTYWWNTQKLFPALSVASRSLTMFSRQDLPLLYKLAGKEQYRHQIFQQGVFESFYRDIMIAFANWEFDPMEMDNPFPNKNGTVHLWQGDDDQLVYVSLQRHIVKKLPWIQYHELPGAGHMFPLEDGMSENILNALLGVQK
ncbi:hypothetical protein ACFE04_001079 [Oxalis oulophora]